MNKMIKLPDTLSDKKVKELAEAGEVKYLPFNDNPKGRAIINGDLYKHVPRGSYHLSIRNFRELKTEKRFLKLKKRY